MAIKSETSSSRAELINTADFSSIKLKVSLKNHTTKTSIIGGRRFFEDRGSTSGSSDVDPVQFQEFTENGMILDVPKRTCSEGHNISIEVETVNAPENFTFHSSAKVNSMESLKEGRDCITITLVQYEMKDWEKFKTLFSGRQEEIFNFFKAVKGQ